jgi:beta-glucosidase
VTNTGERAGADVAQLYLTDVAGERRTRLLGFERVDLAPGEASRVTITADPRLLARFDAGANRWLVAAGRYRVAFGPAADRPGLTGEVELERRGF